MKSIGDENDSNEGYTYRKDFLGEKEVPSRAYYGVQTLRAVENFRLQDIASIRHSLRQWQL